MTEAMRSERSGGDYASLPIGRKAGIDAEVAAELKQNRYDDRIRTLTFTAGQTKAWGEIVRQYTEVFSKGRPERSLQPNSLLPPGEGGDDKKLSAEAARQMASFATWTAWLSVAKRPEAAHSYTNNWPYDAAAGNTATAGAVLWSGASVALLLFALGFILF